MERYIEIALGSPSGRGRAARLSEIGQLQLYAQSKNLELYRSYYFFDQTLVDHLTKQGTIRGFEGSPFIEQITLDIDKTGDTDEHTKERAIAVVLRLKDMDVAEINIRPHYSGSGYHLVLPNLWDFKTVEEVRATLTSEFPECDSIYDKSRIIRVANTINAKTGRYKIPLTLGELLHHPVEQILQLAGTPRNEFVYPAFELSAHLRSSKKVISVPSVLPIVPQSEAFSPVVTCMQKLYHSKPVAGSRHLSILRMVSAFKRSGIPRAGIEAMMISWAGNEMERSEILKIVGDVFEKNYAFSCHDEVMMRHCDSRCMFFAKKSYNAIVARGAKTIEEDLKSQVLSPNMSCINVQDFLHSPKEFLIYPEEFIVLEGDTGLGKSAFVQHFVVAQRQHKTLYLNFEVGERLMTRRFLQLAHGKTKQDILQHYVDPNAPSLFQEIDHIYMVSDRITLNTLEQLISTGEYKIIVVDTLECLITPGVSEITPKTELIAHELKRLAKKYGIMLIAIHHISKSSIMDSQGRRRDLTVHAGKGSTAVEQEADKVILLEGKDGSLLRRIRSAKARDEAPFEVYLMFDAERTFRFYKESTWVDPTYPKLLNDSSTPDTSNSSTPKPEPHSLPFTVARFLP